MADETCHKPQRKTLLQRYEIPVEFLDFTYIENCGDVKTIEKIVKILRSGEEGFFPDLTKCAERKLKLLMPDNKLFREEEPALRKETLDHEKRVQLDRDMKAWISDMRQQDRLVKEIQPKPKHELPIRKCKSSVTDSKTPVKPTERIKSTDYSKWETYDADAEELKIELDEERQRELVDLKNKRNVKKTQLIEEIKDDEVDCLSEFERENLSMKFKEKGNECYKAKDYDEAIKEYTQSLRVKKSAAAYNNRALVYLKLKQYLKVIADTNECLKIEPTNIKALLRKAQAFTSQSMLSEACDTFEKVLDIDASNQTAKTELATLRKKVPMKNAFRMTIEEVEEENEPKKERKIVRTEKLDIPEGNRVPKLVQNIINEDPSPFDRLVPKKSEPREPVIMKRVDQPKKSPLIQEIR